MPATRTDGGTSAVQDRSVDERSRPSSRRSTVVRFGRDEPVLVAVLAAAFIARSFLAGWSTYWYDEMLSVQVYGLWNDTAADAVRHLAENSVHPPLYQFVLYNWMSWFGDGEVATRALSNLYITVAALLLYLTMRDAFSRRIALTTVAVFSVMGSTVMYATETRSYAQTMMLATASSYLLLRLLQQAGARGWKPAVLSRTSGALTLVNAALLLTHYYNLFFWLAQATMVLLFILVDRRPRQWARSVAVAAAMYGLQLAIFAGVWGAVLLGQFRDRAENYELEGSAETPFDLLRTAVLQPNVDAPRLLEVVGLALLVLLLLRSARALVGAQGSTPERQRAWTAWYLAGWMVLPLVVVWVAFSIVGVERYSPRYFLFSVVPLAPLLVLAVEELVRLARRPARAHGRSELLPVSATLVVAVVTLAFVIPTGYEAATDARYAWGATVQQVVKVVEGDPDHDYLIVELSPRGEPLTQFYFERYSSAVRAHDTTYRRQEDERGHLLTEELAPQLDGQGYDRLLLLLVHTRTAQYEASLADLEDRYDVRHRQLNGTGRGFIIYDLGG